MRKIGRTQQKVLDYIRTNPGQTIRQIGDALYDSTSSCAGMTGTIWPKEKIRKHWAAGVVKNLWKRNLVVKNKLGQWSVRV